MNVEAIALTSFIHNDITAYEGKIVVDGRGIPINETIASELERAGLVRIKVAPQYANKMMNGLDNKAGKAPAAGQDTPLSSSPVAQALPTTTLRLPKHGSGRPRGNDTP